LLQAVRANDETRQRETENRTRRVMGSWWRAAAAAPAQVLPSGKFAGRTHLLIAAPPG
jgi:hypothetical protein